MTSVQIAKDGGLMVRLYEADGKSDQIVITPPFEPVRAVLTDLNENVLAEATVEAGKVSFIAAPYRIVQVKIYR